MKAVAPPRGHLFQEKILPTHHGRFWMLVACALVNRTTWEVAEVAFESIRGRYPTPSALAGARPRNLRGTLRPLGLWRQRSERLPLLAKAWLASEPVTSGDVEGLPSCGRYAADSWAIFVEGRRDLEPSDGKLAWYTATQHEKGLSMATPSKEEKAFFCPEYKFPVKKGPPGHKKAIRVETAPTVGAMFEFFKFIDNDDQARREVARMPALEDTSSVKAVCCRLLVSVNGTVVREDKEWKVGFSFNSILMRLTELFPDNTTCDKSLRWYLVRIRQGEKGWEQFAMPTRFERPKSRKQGT